MENQKIINLLSKNDTKSRKIFDLNGGPNYGGENENAPDNIKYETRVLKSNLCD